METIFINYRREDTHAIAGRLYTSLKVSFGNDEVFVDTQGIEPGEPWPESIKKCLDNCQVFLLLIGPKWLFISDKDGRRKIDSDTDWVRLEIESALNQKKIIIPILVGDGTLHSKSAFPPSIAKITSIQFFRLRNDEWENDIQPLFLQIKEIIGFQSNQPPDTLSNPLLGLSLPIDIDLPAVPFQGINSFSRNSASVFFGRKIEIRNLFDLVTNPYIRFVLLYGQSGVGKSSLLFAGLLPRLEYQGWKLLVIIRDAKKGMHQQLKEHLKKDLSDQPSLEVLDQAEEIFTNPNKSYKNEGSDLIAILKNIAQSFRQIKILISFRKEYLANFEELLKKEKLSVYNKFFLQSINREGALEAIELNRDLRHFYGLKLEEGLSHRIVQDILWNEESHTAPLLQLIMRKLWDSIPEASEEHRITNLLYQKIRSKSLQDLLQKQLDELYSSFANEIDNGLILDILNYFTTHQATSAEHSNAELKKRYRHISNVDPIINSLSAKFLLTTTKFKKRSIIRLSHDSLGPIIHELYSTSDKIGQRAARLLDSKRSDLCDGKLVEFSKTDMKSITEGRAGMRDLNAHEIHALDRSAAQILQQEQEIAEKYKLSRATQSSFLGDISFQKLKEGYVGKAISLGLEALPIHIPDWPIVPIAENALFAAVHTYATSFFKPKVYFIGHTGTVQGAVFNSDGSRVLTWSYDGSARMWDTLTGKQLSIFSHEDYILGVAFSQKFDKIITWSSDHTAKIWDAIEATCLAKCCHEDEVKGALFFNDENSILTWSYDGTIRLWDTLIGEQLSVLRHEQRVLGVTFSKDEHHLLTWSFDGTAALWNVADGKRIVTLNHEKAVMKALFSTNEHLILTWSLDNKASLWDIKGQRLFEMDHDAEIRGAMFTKSENTIATWSLDGKLKLWDISSGNQQAILDHGENYGILGMVYSDDGTKILTWASDDTVRLWSAATNEQLKIFHHNGYIFGAAFLPDDNILSWSADGTARIWYNSEKGPTSRVLKHNGEVRYAMFSTDGKWVWTISNDGSLRIWEAERGKEIDVLKHDAEILYFILSPKKGYFLTTSNDGTAQLWQWGANQYISLDHLASVNGGHFMNNSPYLITWSEDGMVYLWESTNGTFIRQFKHDKIIYGAVFLTNETELLTWFEDETAHLWNVETGKHIRSYDYDQRIQGVVFTKKDKLLLTWSRNGNKKLWDTGFSNEIISLITKSNDPFQGVILSGSGTTLIKWYKDGNALIINMLNGNNEVTIQHKGYINGAKFTKDEKRVLTWSRDGTARIWDTNNGEQIAIFRHNDQVKGAEFSADEALVLTWSLDGTVRIWDGVYYKERVSFRHELSVDAAYFSNDERRVLTRTYGLIQLWDATRGERLMTLDSFGGSKLAKDGSKLLVWHNNHKEARLWPIFWSSNDLVERAHEITKYLQPLSKVERCRAHLDTDGCFQLGGTSQRDLAISGNRRISRISLNGIGNLTDFVIGATSIMRLDLEVAVNMSGRIIIFHSLPFIKLKCVKFYKATRILEFMRNDFETRDTGLPIGKDVSQILEQANFVRMILLDDKLENALEDYYLPLDVY